MSRKNSTSSNSSESDKSDKESGEDSVVFEGTLKKKVSKGFFGKSFWHERYFVIRKEEIVWYLSKAKKLNDPEHKKHKASIDLKSVIDLDLLPSHNGCRFDIHTKMGRTVALLAETPQMCKQWYDKINQARSNAPLASLFGPSFKAFEEAPGSLPVTPESHKDYILPTQSVKEGFLALEREEHYSDEEDEDDDEERKIISTKYYFCLTDRLHYLGRALATDLKGASASRIADAIHSAKSLPLHGDTKLEPILPLPESQSTREISKSKSKTIPATPGGNKDEKKIDDKPYLYRFKVVRLPPVISSTDGSDEPKKDKGRWSLRKWRKQNKKEKSKDKDPDSKKSEVSKVSTASVSKNFRAQIPNYEDEYYEYTLAAPDRQTLEDWIKAIWIHTARIRGGIVPAIKSALDRKKEEEERLKREEEELKRDVLELRSKEAYESDQESNLFESGSEKEDEPGEEKLDEAGVDNDMKDGGKKKKKKKKKGTKLGPEESHMVPIKEIKFLPKRYGGEYHKRLKQIVTDLIALEFARAQSIDATMRICDDEGEHVKQVPSLTTAIFELADENHRILPQSDPNRPELDDTVLEGTLSLMEQNYSVPIYKIKSRDIKWSKPAPTWSLKKHKLESFADKEDVPTHELKLTEFCQVDVYHEAKDGPIVKDDRKWCFMVTPYQTADQRILGMRLRDERWYGDIEKVDRRKKEEDKKDAKDNKSEKKKGEESDEESDSDSGSDNDDSDSDNEKKKKKKKQQKKKKEKKSEEKKEEAKDIKIDIREKKKEGLPETYIFAAGSESERKKWMLHIWKVIRDIYFEQHPELLQAIKDRRREKRNRLYAPIADKWSWAYVQDRLLFPWKYRPEGKVEEEKNLTNYILYNHKVLMVYFVPDQGMPRSTRIYLFLLDFLLNLFLTLLMEDEPIHQHFNRPQQSAIIVTVLLTAGFLFRLLISGLYGPILDWKSRSMRIFIVVFVAPGSFVAAMLYYIGILGIIKADEAMIRFGINLAFSYGFELLILIAVYEFTTHMCPRCFNFHDRDLFQAVFQPSKMRRMVFEQGQMEATGVGNYSVPSSSIPSFPLTEIKSQNRSDSPTSTKKDIVKKGDYQKLT